MAPEKEQPSQRPTTSSLFWAEWRRGLKDLQNAVLNPWNGHVATHEETGTIASPTQAEVTAEKGTVYGFQQMLDNYASRGVGRGPDKDRHIER